MNKLYIKPARTGQIVRDPDTFRPLDEQGEMKPRNTYWLRRLKDGDAVTVKKGKSTSSRKG